MSKDRRDLIEPFDSELGSARIDRGEWDLAAEPTDAREGGHPEDAERQLRPDPPEELVGTAGPGLGEPGDEHGSAGMDSGSMDAPPDPSGSS